MRAKRFQESTALPSSRGGSDDRVVLGSGCLGINMAMPYPCHAFRVLKGSVWSLPAGSLPLE